MVLGSVGNELTRDDMMTMCQQCIVCCLIMVARFVVPCGLQVVFCRLLVVKCSFLMILERGFCRLLREACSDEGFLYFFRFLFLFVLFHNISVVLLKPE